ncbi:hypothetical protein CCM_08155 [Cordyceps militaris CM01]|uniref:Uncharacterized protein n=1 Tax=Cordyceps militaris (strain CM01) TaxID=983644 RepID=G3JNR2_CORMM|nr:uncharacterized protein CCM_08155 [Cordyceps militaris CM01]EGX89902.1 hypothetical protein CCM_08155 [Cordyceps militaris CM01]
MCRAVYLFCPYCQFRRFFMWEECGLFWARYMFIVIDQNSFELRPRLSRREDEPPACGRPLLEPREQLWRLGGCPRLPYCPSMRIHAQRLAAQQNQQSSSQQKPPRGGGGSGRHAHMQRRHYFPTTPVMVCNESEEEARRKEFAARYFRKIQVQVRPRSPSVKIVDDADDERSEEDTSSMESAKEQSRRQTFSAPEVFAPSGRLMPGHGLSEGSESTEIESGSEMDSVDWNEQYKRLLVHKISPAQSV